MSFATYLCHWSNHKTKKENVCLECIKKEKQIGELEKKVEKTTEKFKTLQKSYIKALNVNFQNSIKLDNCKQTDILDTQSKKYLTDTENAILNSINPNKAQDSTFVRKSFEFIYTDMNVLQKKSVNGCNEQYAIDIDGKINCIRSRKDPISPEKYQFIKSLFLRRLSKIKISEDELERRSKRMCTNAINNIVRKSNAENVIILKHSEETHECT